MTGPEVCVISTPSSCARIEASVVLPSPGRAVEEHVVERLAAAPGGLDEDAQLLLEARLPDEFIEHQRTEPLLLLEVLGQRLGVGDAVAGRW